MVQEGSNLNVLVLAGLLLASGCIGQVPVLDDAPVEETTHEARVGPPLERVGPPSEATRTLSLILVLDDDSRTPFAVRDVQARPAPDRAERFVENPGRVQAGGQRHVLLVSVPAGTPVERLHVELTVTDGRGEATLSLSVGPWSGLEDVDQRVTVSVPEQGVARILELDGPLPSKAAETVSRPTYGLMLWPDGDTRVLERFPYRVHVPDGFPDQVAEDANVAFWIEDADETIRWLENGQPVETGPRLETRTVPGEHALRIETKAGQTLDLTYDVDHAETFEGTIPLGVDAPAANATPLTTASHAFHVADNANLLVARLHEERTPVPTAMELDLSIHAPDGTTVATGDRVGHYGERIVLPRGLPPGDYNLTVTSRQGIAVEYTINLEITY